jgi:hypothetical protein
MPALSITQQRFQRARCSARSSIANESVSLYLCRNAERTRASSCVSLKTTSLDPSFGVGIQSGQWLGVLVLVDLRVDLGGMFPRVVPGVPDVIGSQGRILVDKSLERGTQSPCLLQHPDRNASPGNPGIAAADSRCCLDTARESRPGSRSIGMGWHRLFSVTRTDQHLILQGARRTSPGHLPPRSHKLRHPRLRHRPDRGIAPGQRRGDEFLLRVEGLVPGDHLAGVGGHPAHDREQAAA